jgi:citronellyl-CoA dehydrogenase
MPGLVPGIHVLALPQQQDVDGRDKPGHDAFRYVVLIERSQLPEQ